MGLINTTDQDHKPMVLRIPFHEKWIKKLATGVFIAVSECILTVTRINNPLVTFEIISDSLL